MNKKQQTCTLNYEKASNLPELNIQMYKLVRYVKSKTQYIYKYIF